MFSVGMNIYVGRKQCASARWRYVFITKAVASVISIIGQLVELIFLLRPIRGDRREGVAHNWYHRCGIVVELVMIVTVFVSLLAGIGMVMSHF